MGLGRAGVEQDNANIVLEGAKQGDQGSLADRLGPSVLVLEDDFRGGDAMSGEVDNMGLVLEESLEQVIRPYSPERDKLEGVAMFGRSNLGRDFADFFVELSGGVPEGLAARKRILILFMCVSGMRANSPTRLRAFPCAVGATEVLNSEPPQYRRT